MAKNNGHWYTDKNGNHYFVENGQSPKEGWEESKRRKMISGGKYMTSEDGNEYSEVDKDKYDAYEADEADFDENVDDDFGFDEEDDIVSELKENGVDMDSQAEIREYLGATLGWDREDQMEFVRNLGFTPFEEDDQSDEEDGDDFEEEEKVRYLDKTYNRYFDSQENWKRNETGNYEIGDDENYGYVLNDGERPGMIRAGRVRNGDHEHPEEEFFEDPQEAKEWVEEVANGSEYNDDEEDFRRAEAILRDPNEYTDEEVAWAEHMDSLRNDSEYDREMKKAQEENAKLSEGQDNPTNIDALYRPDEDKGPRENKGPANPNAPAGQVLYNQDDEKFLKDMGANLKNTQYGRQETLDEYYERVKDKHTDDMDDWKAFISTAYAMSPKEVDRYIDLKEKEYKGKVGGGMRDYVYNQQNPEYGEDNRRHNPTPNQKKGYTPEQKKAIREQINKMVASLDDARSVDEAWDIEEGIKELEDMLKKYKGK